MIFNKIIALNGSFVHYMEDYEYFDFWIAAFKYIFWDKTPKRTGQRGYWAEYYYETKDGKENIVEVVIGEEWHE